MKQSQPQPATVYSREEYATKKFWEDRYKQKQSYFDWYAEFPELQPTFENEYGMQRSNSILMLGCGNSKLSNQMYSAGYHNILNIDISETVIEQMQRVSLEMGQTQMRWRVMDATNLDEIEDEHFDVIIDKGTLDALISGNNMAVCEQMLRESMRVMKKDGQLLLITYGSPEGRKKLFQSSIGLQKYDYYNTKVDLSSMSTLINLMRSNLGNKPIGSILKEQQAMKKTIMEFNLIKALRRRRKNEKKYIVWPNYEFKNVVFNENQGNQEGNKKEEEENKESSKQQENNKKEENNKEEENVKKDENKKQQKSVTYKPVKQCYCFVYSIRNKFGVDIDEVVPLDNPLDNLPQQCLVKEESKITIPGQNSLTPIAIYADHPSKQYTQILRGVVYLLRKKTTNNPITIYSNLEEFQHCEIPHKIVVKKSPNNYTSLYCKKLLKVSINMDSKNSLAPIEKMMENVSRQVVESNGLSAYPTPQLYTYFTKFILKIQNGQMSMDKFMRKYWFMTWEIVKVEGNKAEYHVSANPLVDSGLLIDLLKKEFKLQIEQCELLRQGYICEMDPRVYGIMNLCTVTNCNGESYQVVASQFEDGLSLEECVGPTLCIRPEHIAKFMARLFSSL